MTIAIETKAELALDRVGIVVANDKDGAGHDRAAHEEGWLIPAAGGSWLSATRDTIRRCRVTPSS